MAIGAGGPSSSNRPQPGQPPGRRPKPSQKPPGEPPPDRPKPDPESHHDRGQGDDVQTPNRPPRRQNPGPRVRTRARARTCRGRKGEPKARPKRPKHTQKPPTNRRETTPEPTRDQKPKPPQGEQQTSAGTPSRTSRAPRVLRDKPSRQGPRAVVQAMDGGPVLCAHRPTGRGRAAAGALPEKSHKRLVARGLRQTT